MASLKRLAKLINEKTQKRTPEQEFLHMLEEAIERLARENARVPSKTFKPSSLGGCLRNVYYQVIGAEQEEEDRTASSVGITESGTDRHERIQKDVAEMRRLGYPVIWIDVAEYLKKHPQTGTEVVEQKGMETKLYNKVFNMSFLCDGIILMNGVYYILEVKTEASFKFRDRNEIVDQHKTQASCYAATIGIRRVIFLYENRDVCVKKAFFYDVTDEDIFNRVVSPIELVNAHIEAGTLPPKNEKLCKYCRYKERCKRDGD